MAYLKFQDSKRKVKIYYGKKKIVLSIQENERTDSINLGLIIFP